MFWSGLELRVCGHFYHVGSSQDYHNAMDEALLITPGCATPDVGRQQRGDPAEIVWALTLEEIIGATGQESSTH